MLEIAICGAGGFGREVAMLVEQINRVTPTWRLIGFFDDYRPVGEVINGYKVLGSIGDIDSWPGPLSLALGVGKPEIKRRIVSRILRPDVEYPILRHPSVSIGTENWASIGRGTILCAGTIVTTNVFLDEFVTVNLSCTIGHDARLDRYVSVMPTCNISGNVWIGEGAFMGTGSQVIEGKRIGAEAVIGAGAVVVRDISAGATAVGVPAKEIPRAR